MRYTNRQIWHITYPILITVLINLLVRKMKGCTVLSIIDGALMAIVFTALFFALGAGVDFGVAYVVANAASLPMGEALGPVFENIASLLSSSPVSALLYSCNPVTLFLG